MVDNEPPWDQAVHAVLYGMSFRTAEKNFHVVKREALRRNVYGVVAMHAKKGKKPTYLTVGHEQGMLEVVAARSHTGFCIEEPKLRYIIRQCALAHQPGGNLPPEFPNRQWISRFIKRHKKKMSFRRPQILDEKRAEHSTEEIVRGYARRLEPVISGIAPKFVGNGDETGVCAQGSVKVRVLCSRGIAANTRRSHDRKNVTVMVCVNAAGGYIPPMYGFAGEYKKRGWLAGTFEDAVCATTKSSNINGNVFLHWLKTFVRKNSVVRPQVLIVDGRYSHLSQQSVDFAIYNGIKLFLLPSYTSHFLQQCV
ncbi:DDE superfamily endonuclease [Phytophthora infestans]|uniref:DDE superfamily endonuclease n=1 Tax=Phytophthora infestans TaxID=4787 RepID=A0A833WP78_PHYIN|nr:DDE superfamily endonuclease [Phytophthora infestans]